jgi:hypothetical protein
MPFDSPVPITPYILTKTASKTFYFLIKQEIRLSFWFLVFDATRREWFPNFSISRTKTIVYVFHFALQFEDLLTRSNGTIVLRGADVGNNYFMKKSKDGQLILAAGHIQPFKVPRGPYSSQKD